MWLEIDGLVCGCDYGGTSWTTRAEADWLAALLALEPGLRLLELGCGSGWPGLYFAGSSGCDIALVDLPEPGLRIARDRAATEPLAGTTWLALADGAALPFADRGFDAVSHSDVLCCLAAKLAVLRECRRVVRAGGSMVFTVIRVATGISAAATETAIERGPPYVAAPESYARLLERTGWRITRRADLTSEYAESVRRLIAAKEARRERLGALLGHEEAAERLAKDRRLLAAIEHGLLRRDLFVVSAADRRSGRS